MKRIRNLSDVLLQSRTKKLPIIIVCALVLALPLITTRSYYISLGSLVMCYAILAMSIDILAGYMGLSAFGNAGFFGFGAYCVAFMTTKADFPLVPTIIIAILLTAVLATLFGFLSLKVWGTTFLIVNLALGQIIWGLTYRWTSVTNGEIGLSGIPRPDFFGIDFNNNVNYFYFIGVVFILIVFFLYRYVNSPFGLTVRGIRQERKRMSALGFNVYKHKLMAYVISGTIAGIGGILFVFQMSFISPTEVTVMMASKAFLMSLVGGTATLAGGVIGAAIVVIIENIVSSFTERWVLILGIMYIFTVMVSPKGVMGFIYSCRDFISRKLKGRKSKLEIAEKSNQQAE